MKRAVCLGVLAAFAVITAAACGPSSVKNMWNPTPTPSPSGTGTPLPGNHITANTTWPTAYSMTGSITIDPGVTLTIDSGSTISIAQSASLYVAGVLDVKGYVAGSAGTPTVFQPGGGAVNWGSIDVVSGGTATIRNARFTGYVSAIRTETGALTSTVIKGIFDGGTPVVIESDLKLCRIQVTNGGGGLAGQAGTLTIADSNISSGSSGDATSLSGANLVMDHSVDGTTSGSSNHCLIHSFGNGATVTVTKSVFNAGQFLFDLGGVVATIHDSKITATPTILAYDRQSYDGQTANTVNATSNYWGGTSTPQVPNSWTTAPVITNPNDSTVVDAGIRPYGGTGCETTF